jgi:hypothetical protein
VIARRLYRLGCDARHKVRNSYACQLKIQWYLKANKVSIIKTNMQNCIGKYMMIRYTLIYCVGKTQGFKADCMYSNYAALKCQETRLPIP